MLGVPLLKQGKVVGIIMLFRSIQIELAETFADQAVIASADATAVPLDP